MFKAVPHAQKDIPLAIDSVLLSSECIVCKAYAVYKSRGLNEKVVVCVTNLQIFFITAKSRHSNTLSLRSSRGGGNEEKGACILEKIVLGLIDSLHQYVALSAIKINCKDGRICELQLGTIDDVERIYSHIFEFAFPKTVTNLYAFYNRPNKSQKKIVDFYPNERESDDEDEEDTTTTDDSSSVSNIIKKKREPSCDDIILVNADKTSEETTTETDPDGWDEEDKEFIMYDGWDIFNPKREYLRLGVVVNGREYRKRLPRKVRDQLKQKGSESNFSPLFRSQWRLTKVNRSYEICESYPRYFALPRIIKDEEIIAMKGFRVQQRIPILCFIHPETYASITRSSQLIVGFHGPRNSIDEKTIESIRRAGLNPSAKFYILDARPPSSLTSGRGVENQKYYKSCNVECLGLHGIRNMRHTMRVIWQLARESHSVITSLGDDSQITAAILNLNRSESTTLWNNLLIKIIRASRRIIQLLQQGNSVLVHCSNGRDRTSLLTSLAMLQLDPFYRTIEGFEILIEKEWSSAGYQFQTRAGHGRHNDNDDPQRSPIFVIFLHCVWQFLKQKPDAFEYNEEFLLFVSESVYSCRFGTFLFDCEKERKEADVYRKTCSLWSFTNCNLKFLNPRYKQAMDEKSSVRYARVSLLDFDMEGVQLWLTYFFTYLPSSVHSNLSSFRNEEHNIMNMNDEQLRNRIKELEETQEKLLNTIISVKQQNQELLVRNEELMAMNNRLQVIATINET